MSKNPGTHHIPVTEALSCLPGPQGERFITLFEHGSLIIEVYSPKEIDTQKPHTRDEIYVVINGSGDFVSGAVRQPFGPKDFLFVSAGVEHHFENFSDDLLVWVMFYGPEGGELSNTSSK